MNSVACAGATCPSQAGWLPVPDPSDARSSDRVIGQTAEAVEASVRASGWSVEPPAGMVPAMNVVVLHSGGMDSTVLLHHLLEEGNAVRGFGVDYGQRHRRELQAAETLCRRLGVDWQLAAITASEPLFDRSALTGPAEIPEGHYTDESMKQTVVPNRNMILLALAIGQAINLGYEAVAYAAHAGDHTIYPDCRPAFADAMANAAGLCDFRPVRLLRPFIDLTKADIVRRGAALGVPFELTWSCYQGGQAHCGRCGTCVERREAFALAGIPDPTVYSP